MNKKRHPNVVGHLKTPLCQAVADNNIGSVEWLLDHGADTNIQWIETRASGENHHLPPLWIAASNGNVRITNLLLNAGADVNATKSDTGNSSLIVAAQNGHLAVCSLLIRKGANLNQLGHDGVSPLTTAVVHVQVPLVAQLLHAGAAVPYLFLEDVYRMTFCNK